MTKEAYLYGRFETRMQSAAGDGVVSSFFTYNVDLGCNWPAENNEIDIEMTGNLDSSVQFTTHYPGPWNATQITPTPFNPHAGMHDYAIEWEPGIVRWFIDGALAYTQDAPFVAGLVHPMRILMNLWAADAPTWVGDWDPGILPVSSSYEYVRYYAYTPGNGDSGSNNNFTFSWADEFDGALDEDRWEASEFGGFGGNFCTFVTENVTTSGGKLELLMSQPTSLTYSLVTFKVNAGSLDLSPTDVVYLNGGFNNWCGNCNPMADADGDDVWERTVWLPAGKHEYLFTVNGWSGEVGGPPQGSSCDFQPCDQYANYGLVIPIGGEAIVTETHCWSACGSCPGDSDGDGWTDDLDNCPTVANPTQANYDGDAQGDSCDADDDNDGLSDTEEVAAGTNPLDADSDGDGMPDGYEQQYGLDPLVDDAAGDADVDGVANVDEYLNGTDPQVSHRTGDVNGDGEVDIRDLLLLTRHLTGQTTLTSDAFARVDIYPATTPPDGALNVADLLLLGKLLLD